MRSAHDLMVTVGSCGHLYKTKPTESSIEGVDGLQAPPLPQGQVAVDRSWDMGNHSFLECLVGAPWTVPHLCTYG